jgi:hypothetical protein
MSDLAIASSLCWLAQVGPWQPVGAWSVGLPMGGRLSAEPGSQAEAHIIARTLVALEPEPINDRANELAGTT